MDETSPSALPTQDRFLALSLTVLWIFGYAIGVTLANSDQTGVITIQIESSRSQPSVGTGLSFTGEIKNLSRSTVYFLRTSVVLILPPELQGPFTKSATTWYGIFPTGDDPWIIALKEGDAYRISWAWSEAPGSSSIPENVDASPFPKSIFYQIKSELRFLLFTPGDYKVTVIAKYWPDLESLQKSEDNYRISTQSVVVHVSAPQTVILVGAALGGLVGYLIFPQTRRSNALIKIIMWVPGLIISMLLSAIVAILLSRISETQFLIRVTIADFWGAVAIGFITLYFGSKALEQILGKNSPPPKETGPSDQTPSPSIQ